MPKALNLPTFEKGVFLNREAHMTPPGGASLTHNLTLFRGEPTSVPAYVRFNNQVLVGTRVLLIDEFPMEVGTIHLLAFTDDKIYVFNNVTSQFDDQTRVSGNYTGDEDDFWQSTIAPNPAGDLLYVTTNGK